jgi:hypothetical protein
VEACGWGKSVSDKLLHFLQGDVISSKAKCFYIPS